MSDTDQHEATPRAELERQIMDSNIPKNEREWWAAHEIKRLRDQWRDSEPEKMHMQNKCLRADNEQLQELLRGTGANRYWEGRWRDEKTDNDRLQALLTAKTTPGYELLGATIEKLSARIDAKEANNERLRALLRRHQVCAWCELDSDLAVETRAVLERKP